MPNRVIREGLIDSPKIDQLDSPEERFFVRLMLKADDFGRYSANPVVLKNTLFPLKEDVRATDSSRWLAACEKAGLVRCYETPKGRFLEVIEFRQRTRAEKSKWPAPDEACQPSAGQLPAECQTKDGPPRTYSETYSETEAKTEQAPSPPPDVSHPPSGAGAPASSPRKRAPTAPDEEWIASIEKNPAYEGIDVRRSIGRAKAWVQERNRDFTRRFVINWLNRERPNQVTGQAIPAHPQTREEREAELFRESLK